VAIEEAHVFMPSGESTECSETIARVAREGRKFGVSLIIVSQRPSRLNPDITSQMGSFAISGITHPSDQNFINQVTDEVSADLGTSLPSLNPGEMVLVGHFIKVPALVKTDLVEEKLVGRDLEAVRLWREEAAARAYASTEEQISP
jgi:DNA helicase HerA-like ATPase